MSISERTSSVDMYALLGHGVINRDVLIEKYTLSCHKETSLSANALNLCSLGPSACTGTEWDGGG